MQVKVHDSYIDLPIRTVSIARNPLEPDKVVLFHCVSCGDSIAQIQGIVVKIAAGVEPTSDVLVIRKCINNLCGSLYTFQSLSKTSPITKITLIARPNDLSAFHCYVCRTRLLQFRDNILSSLPITATCSRAGCFGQYRFIDVV